MNIFASRRVTVLAVGVMLGLPFCIGPLGLTTAIFVLIAAVAATGLNILTGYAGQVSLGHAFFMAVGAYTFVLIAEHTPGWTVIALVMGAAAAGLSGAVIGPFALRLQGLYLAIVTVAVVFIGQHFLYNVSGVSGGPAGRAFPPLSIGGFDLPGSEVDLGVLYFDANGVYYYVALALVLIGTWYAHNLRNSRSGRAMQTVRERPEVAQMAGASLAQSKVAAFAISSVFGGLGGALYVSYIGYSEPAHWSLMLSVQFVAAVVIGGLGTTWGPLIGCSVVFALPTVLQQLTAAMGLNSASLPTGQVSALVYGALIVAFLVFEPKGLVGLMSRVSERMRRRQLPADEVDLVAVPTSQLPANPT